MVWYENAPFDRSLCTTAESSEGVLTKEVAAGSNGMTDADAQANATNPKIIDFILKKNINLSLFNFRKKINNLIIIFSLLLFFLLVCLE
jgi:hypothetical protein